MRYGKLNKEELSVEGKIDVENIEGLKFVYNNKVIILNEAQPLLLCIYFGKIINHISHESHTPIKT